MLKNVPLCNDDGGLVCLPQTMMRTYLCKDLGTLGVRSGILRKNLQIALFKVSTSYLKFESV